MELHILMHWNHISTNAAKTGGISLCKMLVVSQNDDSGFGLDQGPIRFNVNGVWANRVQKYGGICQNHSSSPNVGKKIKILWNHRLGADSVSEKKTWFSHDLKCISPGLCFDSKQNHKVQKLQKSMTSMKHGKACYWGSKQKKISGLPLLWNQGDVEARHSSQNPFFRQVNSSTAKALCELHFLCGGKLTHTRAMSGESVHWMEKQYSSSK